MIIYALVVTAGLGAIVIPCLLLRQVLGHGRHSKRRTAAIITFVVLALAGSLLFCHDLWVNRKLWEDDSTAIAALNFVGILMGNAHSLLPTLIGFVLLYVGLPSGVPKKSVGGIGATEP